MSNNAPLQQPMEFSENSNNTKAEDTNKNKLGLNLNFFMSGEASKSMTKVDQPAEEKKPRKRNATPKTEVVVVSGGNGDNFVQTDTPYINSYNETNMLLRGTIAQVDELSSEIKTDIDAIRASKTLKNKYTYLTNLTSSNAALIGNKLAAIRELNSSITQSHNLDLKRVKDLKLDAEKGNDEMRMMDLYNAFINTPIGAYSPQVGPSMAELAIGTNGAMPNVSTMDIGSASPMMMNGTSSPTPLTPEQNRMRMELNPNIKEVVVFDQDSGRRWFDVIDTVSGQSVPNVPRSENFLFDDMDINVRSGIARNRNIDKTWPIVLQGGALSEY